MQMGVRIRQARRKAGFSQTQLAAAITVRRSAVSNWESVGGALPSTSHLVAIALACGVSIEWLGTGRGAMHFVGDPGADVPAADAELVELPEERELLRAYREMSQRRRQLVLDVVRELGSEQRKRKTTSKYRAGTTY